MALVVLAVVVVVVKPGVAELKPVVVVVVVEGLIAAALSFVDIDRVVAVAADNSPIYCSIFELCFEFVSVAVVELFVVVFGYYYCYWQSFEY